MDDLDRAAVAPGFLFSLWELARRRPAEPVSDSAAVHLMVVQGGLAEEVEVLAEAA